MAFPVFFGFLYFIMIGIGISVCLGLRVCAHRTPLPCPCRVECCVGWIPCMCVQCKGLPRRPISATRETGPRSGLDAPGGPWEESQRTLGASNSLQRGTIQLSSDARYCCRDTYTYPQAMTAPKRHQLLGSFRLVNPTLAPAKCDQSTALLPGKHGAYAPTGPVRTPSIYRGLL